MLWKNYFCVISVSFTPMLIKSRVRLSRIALQGSSQFKRYSFCIRVKAHYLFNDQVKLATSRHMATRLVMYGAL